MSIDLVSPTMATDEFTMMANNMISMGDVSELCDIANGDHTVVMTGVRCITATVGEFIKIDYLGGIDGATTYTAFVPLRNGQFYCRNIIKVYDKADSDATLANVYVWR